MAFKKGNTHSTGRKKGAKNKIKAHVKESIVDILDNNFDKVQEDIDALEPKDRLSFLLSLTSYVIPKMRSVEVDVDVQHNALGMSTEDYIELETEIAEISDRATPDNE